MTIQKFFTQEQLNLAKRKLEELPDLSPNRISRDDLLSSLSKDIVMLSTQKGYSASDIKSALELVDIRISEKAIQEIIRKEKSNTAKKPRKSSDKNSQNTVSELR
jgi:Tfp pilus assembly pilus retraction ATPase PilT